MDTLFLLFVIIYCRYSWNVITSFIYSVLDWFFYSDLSSVSLFILRADYFALLLFINLRRAVASTFPLYSNVVSFW